jgi:hypothetical protein
MTGFSGFGACPRGGWMSICWFSLLYRKERRGWNAGVEGFHYTENVQV